MSTVNKANVYCIVSHKVAHHIINKLDRVRVGLPWFYNTPDNLRQIGFSVPTGMTVQEAILLLSRLVPEGTEVYAS